LPFNWVSTPAYANIFITSDGITTISLGKQTSSESEAYKSNAGGSVKGAKPAPTGVLLVGHHFYIYPYYTCHLVNEI